MRLFNIGVLVAALAVPSSSAAQTAPAAPNDDPLRNGAAWGAAIGAAGMLVLARQSVDWCGIGCDADGSMASVMIPGALIGALAGWIADRDAGNTRRDGQRVHARLGPTVMHTWYDSLSLDGTFTSPGIHFSLQPSPHVSFAIEYQHAAADLRPAPGLVPQVILDNTVSAADRIAGWTRAPYRRTLGGTLTEMVGGRLPSIGRVSIEVAGGLTVQKRESWDYYDAGQPGTFKVLNFASPEFGFVYGANVEIAVTRRLMLTPALRAVHVNRSQSLSAGAGLQWRF